MGMVIIHVKVGNGRKVHAAYFSGTGYKRICGGWRASKNVQETSLPVDCKICLQMQRGPK